MTKLPLVAPSTTPVRLVALDLDGTLLNRAKLISRPTLAALHHLIARDVYVVIASARPPRSVRHFYNEVGLKTPQINYNGALVWDEPRRAVVLHHPLDSSLVTEIVEVARGLEADLIVQCEILDRHYTDREDARYVTETGKLFGSDVVAPLVTFLNQPVTKLMLLGDPAALTLVRGALLQKFLGRVTIVQTDADLLQLTHASCGKGLALAAVIETLGVDRSEVLAVGDAENDVAMLQLAGRRVAMSNGYAVAKAVAHWIAPSNEDDGVLAALRWAGL